MLLGRNLAVLPVGLLAGGLALGLAHWRLRLELMDWAAGMFQFGGAFLLACILGNFVSVRAPFRVGSRSLGHSKMPLKALLWNLLFQLLLAILLLLAAVPPLVALLLELGGVATRAWMNLLASVVFLGFTAVCYAIALPVAGRWLQRREQEVLQALTEEVE